MIVTALNLPSHNPIFLTIFSFDFRINAIDVFAFEYHVGASIVFIVKNDKNESTRVAKNYNGARIHD
jgi:hypothetical protein